MKECAGRKRISPPMEFKPATSGCGVLSSTPGPWRYEAVTLLLGLLVVQAVAGWTFSIVPYKGKQLRKPVSSVFNMFEISRELYYTHPWNYFLVRKYAAYFFTSIDAEPITINMYCKLSSVVKHIFFTCYQILLWNCSSIMWTCVTLPNVTILVHILCSVYLLNINT